MLFFHCLTSDFNSTPTPPACQDHAWPSQLLLHQLLPLALSTTPPLTAALSTALARHHPPGEAVVQKEAVPASMIQCSSINSSVNFGTLNLSAARAAPSTCPREEPVERPCEEPAELPREEPVIRPLEHPVRRPCPSSPSSFRPISSSSVRASSPLSVRPGSPCQLLPHQLIRQGRVNAPQRTVSFYTNARKLALRTSPRTVCFAYRTDTNARTSQ